MKKRWLDLQFFADGSDGGVGGDGGEGSGAQGGNATYTYEQLEEIAAARTSKAERAAIANYLRGKGMSEDDITIAIDDFKEKQKANQPDISAIERERDEARREAEQLKHEKVLNGKGVKPEFIEYVAFKVSKMVTDKKNFETAADEFLKENALYCGTGQGYRVSTGSSAGSSAGTETKNEQINTMIRNAFGR